MEYYFIIIYFIILLVSRYLFKKKYGYLLNSTFLTTLIWCVFASVAVINPIGLRQPAPIVHIYSIIFLIAFNLFSYLIKIKPLRNRVFNTTHINQLKRVNYRMVTIELCCFVLLLPLFLLGIQAILSGNAGDYRFMVYFGQNAGFFTKTIPVSVLNTIMIISLYIFFNKGSKGHLTNSVFIAIALSILSSGRGYIFCFLVLYFFMTVVYGSFGFKISKLPIYIGIGGIIFMTVFVRGDDMINSLVIYFSGSFSFLDYIIINPKDYGMDTLHYGYITLSPITEPIMYVIKVLGLSFEKIPSYYLNLYVQDFVDIGAQQTVMFNNNTTALFPFLLDGDWIGVVFGGCFLAFLSNKSYSFFFENKVVGAISYLYVVNGLFMTTISYQTFMSISPFVAVAVIYFCMKPCLKIR